MQVNQQRYRSRYIHPRAKLLARIELAAKSLGRLLSLVMKIAVFLPNWVGDVTMATPTLQAIRSHFGSRATMLGVMRPYVADVLSGTKWIDQKFFYDPRAQEPQLSCRNLVRNLRAEKPDSILLLTNSLRTGVLAWLCGASQRIGYAQYGRGPLLTDKLKFKKQGGRFVPASTMLGYLKLTQFLGCPQQTRWPLHLETSTEDELAADRVWERLNLPPGKEMIVFHNAGGWGGRASSKSWPIDHAAQLARKIAIHDGLTVLFICGPQERAMAAKTVLAAAHPRVKSIADQSLSIGLSKACIRRSRLMVSSDSGPRHFAAAFGVPLVTLFGPTHTAWGDTNYAQMISLQQEVPCGPCMQKTCPFGHHQCMKELTVERVYSAVNHLLYHGAKTQVNQKIPVEIPA